MAELKTTIHVMGMSEFVKFVDEIYEGLERIESAVQVGDQHRFWAGTMRYRLDKLKAKWNEEKEALDG